jgi:hypothetical protein
MLCDVDALCLLKALSLALVSLVDGGWLCWLPASMDPLSCVCCIVQVHCPQPPGDCSRTFLQRNKAGQALPWPLSTSEAMTHPSTLPGLPHFGRVQAIEEAEKALDEETRVDS